MSGFGETKKSKKRKISHLRHKYDENEILKKAINFHYEGNILQASQLYKFLIDQGCQNSTIFSNYGLILINNGKIKDAEFFIRKAIELNPKDSTAHYNLGGILKNQRKIKDAEFFIRKAIELNPKDSTAHYNLAIILKDLGKLEESELSYRKAIKIKPNYAEAHYNLGNLLSSLGKLEESELSYRKVIEINPNYIKAYYSLSLFQNSDENKIWKKQLFSKSILNQKSKEDQIDIYFARANILHKEKKYEESSKFIKLGNQLNLIIHPSNSDVLINKSKALYIETIKQEINQKRDTNTQESIFIVGMPRSGSTLLESILSMNSDVYDLGESEILEESFQDSKKSNQSLNLAERYWEKIKVHRKQINKTTNKNLYNYSFAGIIATQIPNAKIIHCFRNPLDNILSIFRAHFARGIEYSSSLADSAKVYLNQETIMTEYKNKFRTKIYDLNYDSLVTDPNKEIRSLISWIGWKWEDIYLSPHLNSRSVLTRSNVQVRYPINSKSVGNWKNYKELLQPAIEIINQNKKYKNLI